MNKRGQSIGQLILFVIAFILIGTGLGILYNGGGDIGYVIMGFALIGIGVAIIKKQI